MPHDHSSEKAAVPWVDGLTIGQALVRTAERFPHREALVFNSLNLRLNYAEFRQQVDDVARGLLAIGIERGQHVAIWATNVPQWVILQFATARIGAVLVNINPAYRAHELKYVLNQSDAVALFLVDRFKTCDYYAMLAEICPELAETYPGQLESKEFPHLKYVVSLRGQPMPGSIDWNTLLAWGLGGSQNLDDLTAALRPTDPINIQYTSGTTGFPKAATLSHRNLLMNAFYTGQCQRFTQQDRICVPVPFYHCFGCVMGTLCAVVYGAAMIVPADSFQATATLDAVEFQRATALYGVPTMFIAQLQDASFAGRNLSSLRTGIMAGSPCPIEVMRQVTGPMGARELTIAYGQTEASPVITQTQADDPLELRVQTVGRPIPGVEVKIVDSAAGATLGDNQQGELCARGHVVMIGYYKNPEATAAAIDRDGWLHTGDLAVRQENGYYRITGRIKDMVIRGGENIYPREIEEFLYTHEAVEQASVVGVPDPKYVEELCAWVKLKAGATATADDLRAFCRANLAHYKVPRYVKLVEQFPQTVTGKIQKFKIREEMIAELGLKEQENGMSLSQDSLLDITRMSATAIADRVARGEVSAAEVTDAHIRRIEAVNPRLNAVIVERFAEARAEAEAIDRARREGLPLGPLAGVPMTVKETFHLAGTAVTMGVPGLDRAIDQEDGPLVARLKAAGAIILGKTNVPQLMLMHETDNPIFGRTVNPWNPDRGPGGSSGGESAIIAAGGASIGLASDLGGSIRQPAHSCGIHGLKPTTGRLTGMGSEVNLHGMETIGLQSGPLARTVEDLTLAMRVLAAPGQERFDPQTPPVAWSDPAKVSVAGLRIGYWDDDGYFAPSPAIRRAVLEAVEALRERGAKVERFDPPEVAHAMRLYFGLMSADGGADARRLLANAQQDPQVRRLLKLGAFPSWSRTTIAWILKALGQKSQARMILATGGVSADRYWQMTYETRVYVRKFMTQLDAGGFDALVFPPHALPAFKHGTFTDLPMASSYCMLPNLWGVPAGVVAATRVRPGEETDRPESYDNVQRAARNVELGSAGLPVGVEVAARHWREDIVLSLMSALEHHFRQQADYPERP